MQPRNRWLIVFPVLIAPVLVLLFIALQARTPPRAAVATGACPR